MNCAFIAHNHIKSVLGLFRKATNNSRSVFKELHNPTGVGFYCSTAAVALQRRCSQNGEKAGQKRVKGFSE
jgi:hypothetical protein